MAQEEQASQESLWALLHDMEQFLENRFIEWDQLDDWLDPLQAQVGNNIVMLDIYEDNPHEFQHPGRPNHIEIVNIISANDHGQLTPTCIQVMNPPVGGGEMTVRCEYRSTPEKPFKLIMDSLICLMDAQTLQGFLHQLSTGPDLVPIAEYDHTFDVLQEMANTLAYIADPERRNFWRNKIETTLQNRLLEFNEWFEKRRRIEDNLRLIYAIHLDTTHQPQGAV